MNVLMDLRHLIFPDRCLGCGILNSGLCKICLMEWEFQRRVTHVQGLRVFASVKYSPVVSRILLAAKENGIHEADLLIGEALSHSLKEFIKTRRKDVILVPIPSQKSAVRRRGRAFVFSLTQSLAAENQLHMLNPLYHSRRVHDQSELTAKQRQTNMSSALTIGRHSGRGRQVLLVDDLVTSGATLNEAVRALRNGGFCVVGAVTAAVALPLG
ncbi:MAG: phosphoribosyltransferase family protein [Actinobacteria bacterium]|nr:phosphoribosyltransferase family protein [Actinomycetota bacterium]